MSEITKTATFLVVGGIFLGAAWVARPAAPGPTDYDDAGERFFALFDPLEARSLEIVEFDETTGRPLVFQVAQVAGLWSLPSAENYPADAEDQLASVAASVVDLIRSPAVSDAAADHELYGVLDPMTAESGATGVGMRVTLKSSSDKVLVDLIVGKEVRGADMNYVREPGHNRVYTAKITVSKLSTSFDDWIERDLLKLAPADIRRVVVNDYTIDEVGNRLIQRDQMTLTWDPRSSAWSLEGLSESQELVPDKINTMKFALDDLEIVDVHRKPLGLSAELRTIDEMQLDARAVGSLRSRGYYIYDGSLISNEGEMTVGMADGVVYTLRFGEIALGAPGSGDEGADGDAAGASRYLFVTARFDEGLIPPPRLETLPDIDIAALAGDELTDPADEDADGETESAQEQLEAALEQTRQRIERENQRKQAEHAEKFEAGRTRVAELNDRFADWYYVISDSVYQKLRLQRADLVNETEAETDEESG